MAITSKLVITWSAMPLPLFSWCLLLVSWILKSLRQTQRCIHLPETFLQSSLFLVFRKVDLEERARLGRWNVRSKPWFGYPYDRIIIPDTAMDHIILRMYETACAHNHSLTSAISSHTRPCTTNPLAAWFAWERSPCWRWGGRMSDIGANRPHLSWTWNS